MYNGKELKVLKTLEQIRSGEIKKYHAAAFVGGPGAGKSYLLATYPKFISAITCPGEEDTFLNVPKLQKNVVGWEHFIPSDTETAPEVIERLKKFITEEVRPAITAGKCETFGLDNVTFLAEYFWMKKCTIDRHLYKTKGGEFDTRGAYAGLKDDLRDFFLTYVMSLPCNIVLTIHLMLETDEAMERKPDKTVRYNAAVLGSFRDKLAGMVSYMLYLEKKAIINKNGKPVMQYLARTDKSNGKPAKSRLQLPLLIEDISYTKLKQAIDLVMKGNK